MTIKWLLNQARLCILTLLVSSTTLSTFPNPTSLTLTDFCQKTSIMLINTPIYHLAKDQEPASVRYNILSTSNKVHNKANKVRLMVVAIYVFVRWWYSEVTPIETTIPESSIIRPRSSVTLRYFLSSVASDFEPDIFWICLVSA